MNTKAVYITGKTFECKNALKESGWKYDGTRKAWTKEAPAAETTRIVRGVYHTDGRYTPTSAEERAEFARSLGGNRKGCAIFTVEKGAMVWASETYEAPTKRTATQTCRAQNAHDRAWGEGRYGNVSDPDYL